MILEFAIPKAKNTSIAAEKDSLPVGKPSKKTKSRKCRLILAHAARLRQLLKSRAKERKSRTKGAFRLPLLKPRAVFSPQKLTNGAAKIAERLLKTPSEMSFVGTAAEETISFFETLRQHLHSRKGKPVFYLDHRPLRIISPDAALVLIAEMYRADKINPTLKKRAWFPESSSTAHGILAQVGYYEYFAADQQEFSFDTSRKFLKHIHDRFTHGKHAKALINHFEEMFLFAPSGRSTFYCALVECMNNVREHAYPVKRIPQKYNEWWLLGYFDRNTREICFSFYDQGEGIPNTIRTRLRDTFTRGSRLIRLAVEEGISRTRKETRGRGLPSLKKFVDASYDGNLVITSDRSQCVFHKGDRPEEQMYNSSLQGTLVTWNIRSSSEYEDNHD